MTCQIRDLWESFGFGFVCGASALLAGIVIWAEIAWARSGGRVR